MPNCLLTAAHQTIGKRLSAAPSPPAAAPAFMPKRNSALIGNGDGDPPARRASRLVIM